MSTMFYPTRVQGWILLTKCTNQATAECPLLGSDWLGSSNEDAALRLCVHGTILRLQPPDLLA